MSDGAHYVLTGMRNAAGSKIGGNIGNILLKLHGGLRGGLKLRTEGITVFMIHRMTGEM